MDKNKNVIPLFVYFIMKFCFIDPKKDRMKQAVTFNSHIILKTLIYKYKTVIL